MLKCCSDATTWLLLEAEKIQNILQTEVFFCIMLDELVKKNKIFSSYDMGRPEEKARY